MKKLLLQFSILILLISGTAHGQESIQEIPKEVKDQLLTLIVPQLRSFVEKWGTYLPGTTIAEINDLDETTVEIRGKVKYEGELCGEVKADYKFTIVKEGAEQSFKICVYCPYCFLGSVIKYEWDCKGKKYMETKDYVQILSKISATQK